MIPVEIWEVSGHEVLHLVIRHKMLQHCWFVVSQGLSVVLEECIFAQLVLSYSQHALAMCGVSHHAGSAVLFRIFSPHVHQCGEEEFWALFAIVNGHDCQVAPSDHCWPADLVHSYSVAHAPNH